MNKSKVDNKKESKKISKNQTRFSPISDDSLKRSPSFVLSRIEVTTHITYRGCFEDVVKVKRIHQSLDTNGNSYLK